MARGSHLRSYQHPGLLLDADKPFQSLAAYAFKSPRLGARLPQAGTEYLYAVAAQRGGRVKGLSEGLGTARPGYHQRLGSVVCSAEGEYIFHGGQNY